MKIAQITDIHIGSPNEKTFDIDVRASFQKVLTRASKFVDWIVITGDLCFKSAEPNTYQWIHTQLEATGIPYRIISGNHDDPTQMSKYLKIKHLHPTQELFWMEQVEGRPILFLDSTRGDFSEEQYQWLERQTTNLDCDPIIFCHHPIFPVSVSYMDNHHAGTFDRERLLSMLGKHKGHINVFTGHYHVEKTLNIGNLSIHIAPSTFYQINQYAPEFMVDHFRPGFRVIEFDSHSLLTAVHYEAACMSQQQ